MTSKKNTWKGPTVREIAAVAGVGPATVDRVLNHREGVRKTTRERVMAALDKITQNQQETAGEVYNIVLFCVSGEAFIDALDVAKNELNQRYTSIRLHGFYTTTNQFDPLTFATLLKQEALHLRASGVVLVAPEHSAIHRSVRQLINHAIPVVCLTTDLPNSGRSVYIGNDQYAAGQVAGHLIGKVLAKAPARILMIMSVPFRCQQEREMGFRHVLRLDFPHLLIDEHVISNDETQSTCDHILNYINTHGAPAAIYNMAGANRGVAKALQQTVQEKAVLFVGHELTRYSQQLLDSGVMDYVISHDFINELTTAVEWIQKEQEGMANIPSHTAILIHTRYNCGL